MHIVHIKEPYGSLAEAEHDMAGIALLAFLFEVMLWDTLTSIKSRHRTASDVPAVLPNRKQLKIILIWTPSLALWDECRTTVRLWGREGKCHQASACISPPPDLFLRRQQHGDPKLPTQRPPPVGKGASQLLPLCGFHDDPGLRTGRGLDGVPQDAVHQQPTGEGPHRGWPER